MNRLILLIFVVIIGFSLLTEGWKKGRRHRKRKVTKFMHVSDVHFDLFYNQSISKDTSCRSTEGFKMADHEAPYGRIGCDSPEWLLESTLAAMKEKGKDAEFILLTGKSGVNFFFYCGSKNSSKLLFSRFQLINSCHGDYNKRAGFYWGHHSKLTSLPEFRLSVLFSFCVIWIDCRWSFMYS